MVDLATRSGFGQVDLDLGELDDEVGVPGSTARRFGALAPPLASPRGEGSAPPSQPAPSAVAARDDRVAAMRELYARGDAEGALALGAAILLPLDLPRAGEACGPSIEIDVSRASSAVDATIPDDAADPEGAAVTRISQPAPRLANAENDAVTRISQPAPSLSSAPSLTQRQSVPHLTKPLAEVANLPLDHRAGFLLAHVDGMQTLEEILDICAMPTTEALDLIDMLASMSVIQFE